MLEGFAELSKADKFFLSLPGFYFHLIRNAPKLFSYCRPSGIAHEHQKNRKGSSCQLVCLERGYKFSLAERINFVGVGAMSTVLAMVPVNFALLLGRTFAHSNKILESTQFFASRASTVLMGIGLGVFAASYTLAKSNKELKFVGKLPVELKLLSLAVAPLLGRRNESMAKRIDDFWRGDPKANRAITTCGFIHLYGMAAAMEEQGWTQI